MALEMALEVGEINKTKKLDKGQPLSPVQELWTSLYLASVSPNFPIFFCINSLMLDLTHYIQIQHTHVCVCQFSLICPNP